MPQGEQKGTTSTRGADRARDVHACTQRPTGGDGGPRFCSEWARWLPARRHRICRSSRRASCARCSLVFPGRPPSLVSPACAGQPLAPALKFTAAQTEKDGVGQSVRVPGGSPSRVIFMDGREVVSTCSRRLRGGHRAWWAARGTLLCCRSLPSVGVSVTIREVRTERRGGWVPRGTRFFP